VGHPPDRIEDRGKVGLLASEAFGHQEFGQAGCLEIGDRGLRQPPNLLRLVSAVGQPADECIRDSVVWLHSGDATIPKSMETSERA
jgi:hypothetical protein